MCVCVCVCVCVFTRILHTSKLFTTYFAGTCESPHLPKYLYVNE